MNKTHIQIAAAAIVLVLGYAGIQINPELARTVEQLTGIHLPVPSSTGQAPERTATTEPAPVPAGQLPKTPGSFTTAKRVLYEDVYKGNEVTFYCGCDFDPEERSVDLKSCDVTPRKNVSRANRIEAEHVMPAYHFGNYRQCWREPESIPGCVSSSGKVRSGRECCERTDHVFETAHNDLHNLFPSVGEVNGDRSNYSWGMIPGEQREYGSCDIEVDSSIRRAEPPENVRGDIARVYFYMEDTYGFRISSQEKKLFTAWSKQDPVDAWERERNRRIAKIQGIGNRFVE